jgi:threonine dehydratase
LRDIQQAQQVIRNVAVRTPLLPYPRRGDDRQLFLKPECFQPVGSFKLRGAYNKIASLSAEERKRGVIAHSSGNHAQGVAYAARCMGVRAVIVVPENIPRIKLDATRSWGAEVVIVGPHSADRIARAEELAREHGYIPVPPYNDEKIIAGQGTIGLEILQDLPEVELVLVPVSGGGLISGIASAIKQTNPKVKVVGVEPELAADAQASLRKGERVTFPAEQVSRTIADGLRTTPVGEIPFAHIKTHVDDIVSVSEAEIRRGVRQILMSARILAEPSGAVAPAAFLFRESELPKAKKTVAVVSGGNIEPELLAEILLEKN